MRNISGFTVQQSDRYLESSIIYRPDPFTLFKKKIDKAREEYEQSKIDYRNLKLLIALGTEVQKASIKQGSYLAFHFDHKDENDAFVALQRISDLLSDPNNTQTQEENLKLAKTAMQIIDVYEERVFESVLTQQEVVASLLLRIESFLKKIDFKKLHKYSQEDSIKVLGANFSEWNGLVNQLQDARKDAATALEENLAIERIIPAIVVDNDGVMPKQISATEMKLRVDRATRLLEQSSKKESELLQRISELAEGLFGKPEEYMNNVASPEQADATTAHPVSQNPLQGKVWFRFLKVLYVVALVLTLLLGWALYLDDPEIGSWFIVVTVAVFFAISKVFYYIVLGKTSWKK